MPVLVRLGMQNSSITAYGKYSVAISDSAVYQQKVGDASALQTHARSVLAMRLADILGQIGLGAVTADGLGARTAEMAGKLQESAAPDLAGMGLKLTRVTIEGLKVSPANV